MSRTFWLLGAAMLIFSPSLAAQERNRIEIWTNESLKSIVMRVEGHIDAFENALHSDLDKSTINGSRHEDWINKLADELQDGADDMVKKYKSKNDPEFLRAIDDTMVAASAINRVMLNKRLATSSEPLWITVRDDLNKIASEAGRTPLANLVVVPFVLATPELMGKSDVQQVMDRLEDATDRFASKFKKALNNSTANMTKRERIWNRWADELESRTDELLSEWKEKDYKEAQEELETALVIADALNRVMMESNFNEAASAEWRDVKRDLNTLAQAFTYPALS
jgi:hypothetical protein